LFQNVDEGIDLLSFVAYGEDSGDWTVRGSYFIRRLPAAVLPDQGLAGFGLTPGNNRFWGSLRNVFHENHPKELSMTIYTFLHPRAMFLFE
jgi:hypothetical protein